MKTLKYALLAITALSVTACVTRERTIVHNEPLVRERTVVETAPPAVVRERETTNIER